MSGRFMPTAFNNPHYQPLFSTQWTPKSTESHAGACILLIVLEVKWHDRHVSRRRYLTVAGGRLAIKRK
jgi:hypothetical protein